MSSTPSKKSVFTRIGGGGMSSSSTSSTANPSNKSTHGFCNSFVKYGSCSLGDTCKYIHEQPNIEKQSSHKDELRITKTINRVVDISSSSFKSTVTVSNDQRPVVILNSAQSTRTVVESLPSSNDLSERRSSNSDRKQSQSQHSDSKSKPSSTIIDSSKSSKKKKSSSSHESRHSSTKKTGSVDRDSVISSDSDYSHSSHKRKKKSDHSSISKHKKHGSKSPTRDGVETLNTQLMRPSQSSNKSPKRTILLSQSTEKKKEENPKRPSKDEARQKSRSEPEIEFLGSKKISRDKKPNETIHQQAESNKKSSDVKREKKSPHKSSSDQQKNSESQRVHSSSTTPIGHSEKTSSSKTADHKHGSSRTLNSSERYERPDRSAPQSTPSIVQLSPTPDTSGKNAPAVVNESEKLASALPPSPPCVILDDDSSPAPSIDKKSTRQTPTTSAKKSTDTDKSSSKATKRSRESDKALQKDKPSESTETKRKRLTDGSSKKATSTSKPTNDDRSASNRSDGRRSANTAPRDESSSRKYNEKSESKSRRPSESKDRVPTSTATKSRSASDRHDRPRDSSERGRSTHRRDNEKGLENVTDTEEHHEEPVVPKQTALEAYMAMDWSLLSRDKRIPLNSQATSRITRVNSSTNALDSLGISERLLTEEQKEKLNRRECQPLPLTYFMRQLQTKSSTQIVHSCQRRFGSCARDMIEMRHKWFIKSIEPVQQYEFMNKEHYVAFEQSINSLLNKTPADTPIVAIETTSADALLS